MKIIKINITCLVALLSVLFIGCEVDYKDIDTLGKADSGCLLYTSPSPRD